MNQMSFHRRNLPHYYLPNSTYFITFRLKDSIPLKELVELQNTYDRKRMKQKSNQESDRDFFYEYDNLLHSATTGRYLNNQVISKIIKNEIHKYVNKDYKLICYSIMPNHVHLIFHLLENGRSISKIMQSIKRTSAYYANLQLNRKGSFWQAESYDRIVRNEDELKVLIEYTLMNPVKAGLVSDWKKWDNNYLTDSL